MFDDARLRKRRVLIKGGCAKKHTSLIPHIGHVPVIERLAEGGCASKHIHHIRNIGHVPIVERLVEGKLHDSL